MVPAWIVTLSRPADCNSRARLRAALASRAAYQKIFENVVVLGWGQWLVADRALERAVNDTRLRPHPNDLITCLTTRACKIARMIALHALTMY